MRLATFLITAFMAHSNGDWIGDSGNGFDVQLIEETSEFYKGCEKPGTIGNPFCSECTRKWCAGALGKDCIATKSCTFALSVYENKTHFFVSLLQNTIDFPPNDNNLYTAVFAISPFLPMQNSGVPTTTPTCKPELRMRDLKFRIFQEKLRPELKVVQSKALKIQALEKENWQDTCSFMKTIKLIGGENSKGKVYRQFGMEFAGEYHLQLSLATTAYVSIDGNILPPEKSDSFMDSSKYYTTDGFMFLNFDNSRSVSLKDSKFLNVSVKESKLLNSSVKETKLLNVSAEASEANLGILCVPLTLECIFISMLSVVKLFY